jgi:hypothetical protein
MRAIRIIGFAAMALALATGCTLVPDRVRQRAPVASPQAQAAQALLLGRKVADWQLSHMDRFN